MPGGVPPAPDPSPIRRIINHGFALTGAPVVNGWGLCLMLSVPDNWVAMPPWRDDGWAAKGLRDQSMRRHVRSQGRKPTLGRWTAIRVLTRTGHKPD
jgi:hypothetical protein